MLPAAPAGRLSAHVELFKRDERTGQSLLVHTSRPCPRCGGPLDAASAVIQRRGLQQHLVCPPVAHAA